MSAVGGYAAGVVMVAAGAGLLLGPRVPAAARRLVGAARRCWYRWVPAPVVGRRGRLVGLHREPRPHRQVRVIRPVLRTVDAPTVRMPALADRTELIPRQSRSGR